VDRLEAHKRTDAHMRQAIARDVFAGLPVVGHPASYFLWLPLAEPARADRVAATLARHRISVATAAQFATTPVVPQALRLALASVPAPDLRQTLATVRSVVDADVHR
jgi:DNA-binding transcriptional MocR family regulator